MRIVSTCMLIALFAIGCVCAKSVQYAVGAGFTQLSDALSIKIAGFPFESAFQLNDGTKILIRCSRSDLHPNGDPDLVRRNVAEDFLSWMTCVVEFNYRYITKVEIWNSQVGLEFRTSANVFRAPWIIDSYEASGTGNKITASAYERSDDARFYLLGSLKPSIPICCFDIRYNIESDSFNALLVSAIQSSARTEAVRLDDFGVSRIARQLSGIVGDRIGIFKIRHNWAPLFSGTFQTLVMSVFFSCAIMTLVATSLAVFQKAPTYSDHLGSLASNIAGSLTYFGLLGTLLGIFLAVGELSAIDFVDEMMKVFDQTKSFGAMSLALGSSVLGLGGALFLWVLQACINFILQRRLFDL